MNNRDGGSVNEQIKKTLWSLTSVVVFRQIRQDPGRGKIEYGGSLLSNNLRVEGYNDKPNA